MQSHSEVKTTSRALPWIIWGLAAVFYAYEYFLQVSPSVMVHELMRGFSINATALGNLIALYVYAYACMQIPAGLLLDCIGPRRLLTAASATCVVGAFLFGIAHVLWMAQLGRLLIGFGSAFAAIGTFKLATIWFPANRFAFLAGLTLTIGMMGAVFGSAPLAVLVEHVTWRQSMMILAGSGVLVSSMIWLVVRDSPNYFIPSALQKVDEHKTSLREILASLSYLFKQPQTWLIAIYGGLMFAPTPAFAGLWGTSFLMTKYHVPKVAAASATSMIFIGWAIGSPVFGFISDYLKRRKPTMYVAAIGGFISIILAVYVKLPFYLLYIPLLCFGIFSSGFLPAFAAIREINPPKMNATALGFMNMLNMVGAAILQPLIGWVLDLNWHGVKHLDARVYSVHAYSIALLVLPICLGLALVLLPLLRETHCRPLEDFSILNKTAVKPQY